jgi:MurNAc alpha-1-phosphate uridylyltransferase
MPDSLAAVVLAAGAGERLRPLTRLLPKPLCPVANVPLLDHALARVTAVVSPDAVAVNVHHHRSAMEAHLAGHPDVHVSVEEAEALGTAGGVGHLRGWLDGRPVLVVNGDSWSDGELGSFVAGWDGGGVRLLLHGRPRFGPRSAVVACLLPGAVAAGLPDTPAGLYEVCWRPAAAAGALETAVGEGRFVDCGTPESYLRANRLAGPAVAADAALGPAASVAASCVGAGAVVDGEVVDSVVWPGAQVFAGERLVSAVRADHRVTVLVR